MKYLVILVLITACEYITACTPEQKNLPQPKCVFGNTAKITGNSFYVRCNGDVEDRLLIGFGYRYLLNNIWCINDDGSKLIKLGKSDWFEESQLICTSK